jgi:acyl-CoA thioesterase
LLFSDVLDAMSPSESGWSAMVTDDWSQGRSVFGGLQGALAIRAMRAVVSADVPLRVLQMAFVAPIATGALHLRARVLRTGKSVTHVEARILDGEQTASLCVGVFGRSRPSRVEVVPRRAEVRSPTAIDTTFIPGLTPNFTQHFSMRWLLGALPFTGSSLRQAVVDVGLADRASASEAHVAAIADAIPAVALAMLDAPAAASSLTWTLEILRDGVADLPLSGWRLDAEIAAGRDGYTSQSVMVWGPGGEPVALSRQSMVVFG